MTKYAKLVTIGSKLTYEMILIKALEYFRKRGTLPLQSSGLVSGLEPKKWFDIHQSISRHSDHLTCPEITTLSVLFHYFGLKEYGQNNHPLIENCLDRLSKNQKLNLVKAEPIKMGPPKAKDWLSAQDLVARFGGNTATNNSIFKKFVAFKTIELSQRIRCDNNISEEGALRSADVEVFEQWIGFRTSTNNFQALCASPCAVEDMMVLGLLKLKGIIDPELKIVDQEESDWDWLLVTSSQDIAANWSSPVKCERSKEFVGNSKTFRHIFLTYAQTLVKSYMESNKSDFIETAYAHAQQRVKALRKDGNLIPYICPEGLNELVIGGLMRRSKDQAPPKEDWVSGVDLHKEYKGGSTKYNNMFKKFAERKRNELISSERTESEVTRIIEGRWVGTRTPNSGRACLCASPETIEEMVRLNILTPAQTYRRGKPQTLAASPS